MMTRTATLTFASNDESKETTLGQFVYRPREGVEETIPVSALSAAVTKRNRLRRSARTVGVVSAPA
jgi:hypothetical protein